MTVVVEANEHRDNSGVCGLFRSKLSACRSFVALPPRSESMAGVIILYVFTNSIATSVWMFNAWTPFIYLLFGESNWHVGLMSAVNGVFELSTAFLSGYLADHVLGPSKTLRMAVMMGLVNLCVVLTAVWSGKTWLLVIAQMCEGTYMGFSFTCVESVFAQCMPKGQRDRLYSLKFAFEASGPIVGLVMSIVLFLTTGNSWQVPVLRKVMTAGLLLHATSMATFLWAFVPLPWHLDKKKATDVAVVAGAREGSSGLPSSPVAVVAARPASACDVYDSEEPRTAAADEMMETELPPLFLSRRAEMINQARTAVLQFRSQHPSVHVAQAPSVCTAYDCPHGADGCSEGGDYGECSDRISQRINTLSFFSAAAAASTRRAIADGDDVEDVEEGGDGDAASQLGRSVRSTGSASRKAQKAAAAGDSSHPHPPQCHGEHHNDGREVVGFRDLEYEEAGECRQRVMDRFPLRVYPLFVVIADMVLTVGSGMTTQYFSLFMMSIYGISPVLLNVLNLLNSVIISAMAIVNGIFGKRFGRVRAMLPTRFIGTFILLYMALARDRPAMHGEAHHDIHAAKRAIMCVCYVVRNAFMNCAAGLSRALIMDLVNEASRGRWNALESVQAAGWSGTALIGGVLADKWGYGAAFIITFFFHLGSGLMLTPLTVRNDSRLPVPIYADEEEAAKAVDGVASSSSGRAEGERHPDAKVAELTVANVMRIASTAVLASDKPRRKAGAGSGKDSDGDGDGAAPSAASEGRAG